jgi:prolyl oligopeptidase
MIRKLLGLDFRTQTVFLLALLFATKLTFADDRPPAYPPTRRAQVVEDHFGTLVADPFRWLEDDKAPEVTAWADAQNALTRRVLDALPYREAMLNRLQALWNYDAYGRPQKRGPYYFFTIKEGLRNQPVLYQTANLNEAPRVLLDPNTLSEDGTVAMQAFSVSDDGKTLAYSLSHKGSDWVSIHFRDIETGEDLKESIPKAKFTSLTFSPTGKGLFYSRFDNDEPGKPLTAHKLYYHELNSSHEKDELILFDPKNPGWMYTADLSHDGNYLIVSISGETFGSNLIYVKDLTKTDSPFVKVVETFDGQLSYVENDGQNFTFLTTRGAERGRVIQMTLGQPPSAWKTIIPESTDILQSVSSLQEFFLVLTLHNAATRVGLYDQNGKFLKEIPLPEAYGTGSGLDGSTKQTERYFTWSSFVDPGTVFRYDAEAQNFQVWKRPKLQFNPEDFLTEQVFATSKDGARVPVFVSYKRGLQRNGLAPTILYGYGGFDYALTPAFRADALAWMEMGGIYAVATLRGGGEFGKAWHEAGMGERKQNVFNDFIAAAEFLISQKFTSSQKLAINGGSNGGLLVGAALTQRPELFAAAIPEVGVLDMLRFHKFTIGRKWMGEYGNPETPSDFPFLYRYSPIHQLRLNQVYPPTLIMTADHDDRVVPAHSFKFAAALQLAQGGPGPILLRLQKGAGHGAGTPTSALIAKAVDRCTFALAMTGAIPEIAK